MLEIDLLETLKPELIAPVVCWLCHEDCEDNGAIIEAAGGWAGKCRFQCNFCQLFVYIFSVRRSLATIPRGIANEITD